jgi:hypothetical protein
MQFRYGLLTELVVARGIPFRTICEHHLLPFSGLAHVGYLPGERIIGLARRFPPGLDDLARGTGSPGTQSPSCELPRR